LKIRERKKKGKENNKSKLKDEFFIFQELIEKHLFFDPDEIGY